MLLLLIRVSRNRQDYSHLAEQHHDRRAAVAEERQTYSGVRNKVCNNSDVEQRLDCDLTCYADNDKRGKCVGRLKRYNEAAPYKQRKEYNYKHRADKAELLRYDRKDEVVLRRRNIKMLLSAVSEPHSEKSA